MSTIDHASGFDPEESKHIGPTLPDNLSVRERVALELLHEAKGLQGEAHDHEEWKALSSIYSRIEALLDPGSRSFTVRGDLAKEGVVHQVQLTGRINSIATSLDGSMIIVGSGAREGAVDLFLYDENGLHHCPSQTLNSAHIARKVALNADSSLLAVAYDNGEIHVHRLRHGTIDPIPLFAERAHGTLIRGLSFKDDGSLVATVSDRSLMVLELDDRTGKMVERGRYSGHQLIRDVKASPDGRYIYLIEAEMQSEGNGLKILDTTQKVGSSYKVQAIRRIGRPSALGVHPDRDELVVGEHTGWIYLYSGGAQKTGYPASGPAREISYSPAGNLFAVAEADSKGGVEVFTLLKEGRLSRVAYFLDSKGSSSVCFSSSQGYLVAGNPDGTLRVFA